MNEGHRAGCPFTADCGELDSQNVGQTRRCYSPQKKEPSTPRRVGLPGGCFRAYEESPEGLFPVPCEPRERSPKAIWGGVPVAVRRVSPRRTCETATAPSWPAPRAAPPARGGEG